MKFDPKVDRSKGYSEVTSRGVSTWADAQGTVASSSGRLTRG